MATPDNDALTFLTPEEAEVAREMEEDEKAGIAPLGDLTEQVEGEGEGEGETVAKTATETTAAPPVETTTTTTAPSTETTTEAPPVDAPAAPYVPVLHATHPENFDDRMAEFATRKDELDQKFDAGELSSSEYRKALEAVNGEADELRNQEREARFADAQNEANAKQIWRLTIDSYAAGHRELQTDAGKAAWNAEHKALLQEAENNAELMKKPMTWFLAESHRRMRATLGIGGTAAAPETTTTTPAGNKPPVRKPPAAPASLHNMPNAGAPDTGSDEFAHINKLDGLAQEAALADLQRRDPHGYDRWLERG